MKITTILPGFLVITSPNIFSGMWITLAKNMTVSFNVSVESSSRFIISPELREYCTNDKSVPKSTKLRREEEAVTNGASVSVCVGREGAKFCRPGRVGYDPTEFAGSGNVEASSPSNIP